MTTVTTDRITMAKPRRFGPSPWLLLAPSIVLAAVLFGWPLVSAINTAFTGDNGVTLDNWQRLVADPYFLAAIRNTVLLIVAVIPIQVVLAVGMALLLQSRPRLAGIHFYLWTIPLALSDLAAGLVWLTVFTDHGYLNSLLVSLGWSPVEWLNYNSTAMMLFTVAVAELWRSTSLVFVIVMSGIQMMPRDYAEAAGVFGATAWQRLWHVTLPMLRPSLQVALILRTILALQSFAVAQALTGRSFPLLVGETYEWYVNLQDPGVASAVALVVLAVSAMTAVIYLRTLRTGDDR